MSYFFSYNALICFLACFLNIHVHSCLKPFSIRPNGVFKQQYPHSNNENHMPFEQGFWIKSNNVIGQWDVPSLCSVETKWSTLK